MIRPSRRALLTLGAGLGLTVGAGVVGPGRDLLARPAASPSARRITVESRPIVDFSPKEPGQRRFGRLDFLGGLVLTSPAPDFGSLSALRTRDHGRELLAIGDEGTWVLARLDTAEDGRPIAVREARLARLRGADGQPLRGKRETDAESLEIRERDGVLEALVGFERHHRVLVYRSDDGWAGFLDAPGKLHPNLPKDLATLGNNESLEAIALAPPASPLAEALVLMGEEPRRGETDHPGWILGGPHPGTFHVRHRDDFALTDACFLPSGDLLLLERRFRLTRGIAMRIRRIARADLAPGRTVDGEILLEADGGFVIDNMEGLAVDRAPDGSTILTLVSDDNQSFLQNTILLRFRLPPP